MPQFSKKPILLLLLAGGLTIAAVAQDNDKKAEARRAENLKVLPKNISHDSLISIMKVYSFSLGVKCNFCHTKSATEKDHLDFASDDNKHKHIARDMMRMTAKINKKYFGSHDEAEEHTTLAVSCFTCHRGHDEPQALVMPKEEGKH